MLAYGFDVTGAGGALVFRMRDARPVAVIGPDDLAESRDLARPEIQRAPEPELSGRVRVTHVEAGTDYETSTAEAALPDDGGAGITSDSEMPLSLTRAEGRALAERWLAESRVARDSLRLALPPSRAAGLEPGGGSSASTPAPGGGRRGAGGSTGSSAPGWRRSRRFGSSRGSIARSIRRRMPWRRAALSRRCRSGRNTWTCRC